MYLTLEIQILVSALVFLLAGGLVLPNVHREYLQQGRLRPLAAFLQLVVWILFHAFLGLTVWRDLWPSLPMYIPKYWFGMLFILAGLTTCLAGMGAFHSFSLVFGYGSGKLITTGIYNWTRNPQYTGYGSMVFGIMLGYWSETAWLAFLAYTLLAYATVRIEEDHLTNVFGNQYRAYCKQVPRFIGLHKRQNPAK